MPLAHAPTLDGTVPPTGQGARQDADDSWMLGAYRILGKLGEGGMGIVYEAEQQHPRRLVALKVIRGGRFVDEQHIKMFQREIDTLARLKHPHIGAIYDAGRVHRVRLVLGEARAVPAGSPPPPTIEASPEKT